MITLIVLTVLGVALVAVGTALIFVFKNTIRQTIEKVSRPLRQVLLDSWIAYY